MKHFLRKIWRDFLTFSKAEQYGIVALIFLIFLSVLIYFTLPYFVKTKVITDPTFRKDVENFIAVQQHIRDSIRIDKIQSSGQLDEELAKQKIHPFTFDPNMLPAETWKKLGLTDKQIKVIKNYEAKGGKFYTKKDLKKLYCISDAEYKILEPYIVIKPFRTVKDVGIIKHPKPGKYKFTELNTTDSATLSENLKIPGWMALRIIKYRNKLGGFYDNEQLLEVYGMKEKYFKPIEKYIYADTAKIGKICINQAGFKMVLRHPYINYDLTKKIFDKRRKLGGQFNNIEEVLNIITNSSLRNKLSHYLYICPPDLRDN